jgi:hypothetical protein
MNRASVLVDLALQGGGAFLGGDARQDMEFVALSAVSTFATRMSAFDPNEITKVSLLK